MHLRRRLPAASSLRSTLSAIVFIGLLPYIANALPVGLFPRQTTTTTGTTSSTIPNNIRFTESGLCVVPAPWTQILSFFVTNYIARIATFKKTSGYEGSRDYFRTIVSLFVPFFGISQAASTIARGSRFLGKDEIGKALHAGTLCIVQRQQTWKPKNGDVIRGCTFEEPSKRSRKKNRSSGSHHREEAVLCIETPNMKQIVNPTKWKIQGQYNLPNGYGFAKLPPGTSLGAINPTTDRSTIVIASSYGTAKSFLGALQILFSIYTLYGAYGAQVASYGYAAFGFSVIPYTIMSFLNAIANIIEADYDTLFMIESEVMVEAFGRTKEEFVGAVGALIPDLDRRDWTDIKFKRHKERGMYAYELDANDEETGRKWKVVEAEPLGAEFALAAQRFDQPVGNPQHALPMIQQKEPVSTSHCTKIIIPGAGQYQRKKKEVKKSNRFYHQSVTIIVISALILPYIILGALSRFRPEGSTMRQRTFMMGWLVSGQVLGVLDLAETKGGRKKWWRLMELLTETIIVIIGFAFSIGGFIEAGRMMRNFGFCLRLPNSM